MLKENLDLGNRDLYAKEINDTRSRTKGAEELQRPQKFHARVQA